MTEKRRGETIRASRGDLARAVSVLSTAAAGAEDEGLQVSCANVIAYLEREITRRDNAQRPGQSIFEAARRLPATDSYGRFKSGRGQGGRVGDTDYG